MNLRPKSTLAVAFLLAAGMTYYYFALLIPQVRAVHASHQLDGGYYYGGDLYPIWFTTRELLFHHRNPYSNAMTGEIQTGLFGRTFDPRRPSDPPEHYRAFSYPLYTDVIATPLTWLSFRQVQYVLAFASPLLVAVGVWLWLVAFDLRIGAASTAAVILLTMTSYAVLEAIFAQQPAILVGVSLATTGASLKRERYLLAGVCLAIAAIKPQLMLLLAIWLLLWAVSDWDRRKTLIFGFVLTLALLLGASQLVLPGWFSDWRAALVEYRQYTEPPLVQFVLGKWLGGLVEFALLLLGAGICWRTRRAAAMTRDFALTLSLALVITIVTLPTGGAVYDHILLLPAILWLYSNRDQILRAARPLRLFVVLGLIALSWQWIAACLVDILVWPTPGWRSAAQPLVFPLRTAAPLPFAVLAALVYFAIGTLRGNVHEPVSQSSPLAA
ncbi:MAG TPA: glycosyltransferase family 87 protein [Terriglobales bacterium]|nr:glycosyltransferase family 87 protein [Terriglobales bacterium]